MKEDCNDLKWIAIACCAIIFVCCLVGCSSAPDIAEPLLESTAPTEDTQDDEITVYPADMDVFYSLESFLEYATTAQSGGLADLATLQYFYLPTGIPDGYRLYKITAAKNDIGFWYLPEEALVSDDTILSAESRNEHFMFISPRVYYSCFAGDETLLTWQEDGDLLMLYLPKNIAVEDRDTLCSVQKYVRTDDNTFQEAED